RTWWSAAAPPRRASRFVIDGATALALRHPPPLRGARPRPPLVRSTRLANLTDHLPERERPFVRLTLAAAWRNPDAAAAERSLGAPAPPWTPPPPARPRACGRAFRSRSPSPASPWPPPSPGGGRSGPR